MLRGRIVIMKFIRFVRNVLLLVFAMLQCVSLPAHAHLNAQHQHGSGEHQHGSGQHQHDVQAHAHQPVVFHAASIDVAHQQMHEATAVDLDHDQGTSKVKKFDGAAALADFVIYTPLIQAREAGLGENCTSLSRLLHQPPGQPRAPPQLS